MTMLFDIYTKEVELETKTGKIKYNLRPLSGRYLPKLFNLLKKLDIENKDSNKFIENLSEDIVADIHLLVLETFKASYPNEKVEDLDVFVSQNLMQLFPSLIEVNFNNKGE